MEYRVDEAHLAIVGLDVASDLAVSSAVLLLAILAVLAGAARVHHAADTDVLPDLELGDVLPNAANDTGNLMAGDHGERDLAPFLDSPLAIRPKDRGTRRTHPADGVDVAVADARVLDVDDHVVIIGRATLDRERLQGLLGAGDTVRLNSGGHFAFVKGRGRVYVGCGKCRKVRNLLAVDAPYILTRLGAHFPLTEPPRTCRRAPHRMTDRGRLDTYRSTFRMAG